MVCTTSGISSQARSETRKADMMLSARGTTHQYSGIGYPWILSRISIYIHVHFKNGSALNKDGNMETWQRKFN